MPGELTNQTAPGSFSNDLTAVPYNIRRNLFHMANATWGVLIYHFWAPRWLAISLVAVLTVTLTVAEVLRLRAPRWNARLRRNRLVGSIIRPSEANRISGATFFGWGVLLTLVLFPRPVAEVACLVLGFGDSAATLVGTRWGRTRILGGRTLEAWTAVFDGTDACAAPVLDPPLAARHPHLAAREVWTEVNGQLQARAAPRFDGQQPADPGRAPLRGEHTDEILDSLELR